MIKSIRKGKIRISVKVFFSFLILVLFQGILTQIGMYQLIYQSNVSSFQDQLKIGMEGIDSFLIQSRAELVNKVNLLSGQKNVIEYSDFRLRNLLRRDLSLFNQALDLDGIYVFVESGRLLTSDKPEGEYIDTALQERITEAFRMGTMSFLHDDGKGMYMWCLGQIVRENEVIGMVGARAAIDSGYVDIIEKNTNSVTLLEFPGRNIHTDKLEAAGWMKLMDYSSSMQPFEVRYAGDYLVGVMEPETFDSSGGRVICVFDMREMKKSIRDYNRFAVILTLLVIFSALVISILFYRKTFLRPYNALHDGMMRIGNGDFTYPIKQTSGDEFGDLVESVNRMRINLLNRDRELRELASYNELILNNVRSGIITVGHDGMINTCNAAAVSMVHMDNRQKLPIELEKSNLPQEIKNLIMKGIDENIHVNLHECRLTYEGRQEILTLSTSPFSDGTGENTGIIAVIADVTQIRKLEEQLQVSQRLAEIGEMVAGVSHQLRNPLAIMKVSAEILRDSYREKVDGNREQYADLTKMLVSEIDCLNYVIHNFLNFARPLQLELTPCNMGDIVMSALSHIPVAGHPGVSIKTDFAKGIPLRDLDRNLMEQVVRNLVQNALEATVKGEITINLAVDNGKLVLAVRDTGSGMDSETLQNIFTPFFSKKNKGTGLGLSIVHRIVQEHGGTIHAESRAGDGSVFTVIL